MKSLIEKVRAGNEEAPSGSALETVAYYRDRDDALLPAEVAAVEMVNVLRPTVAVSAYVTFIAHALHMYPECRRKIRSGDAAYLKHFVQEVRRFYPFFPAVTAVTRYAFEWRGYEFPAGRTVLLDLYGTNRDPRTWERPDEFLPERFRHWNHSEFNFIPQGGGDHYQNHRCPGEWITIEIMKVAANFLVRGITYDVPNQDLRIAYQRLPALPNSKFIMSAVKNTAMDRAA